MSTGGWLGRVRSLALAAVGSAALFSVGCDEGPFLVSGVVIGDLSFDPSALAVAEEEVDSVTLEVFDEDGVLVRGLAASWVSEDPSVATVSGRDGGATVTGVSEGATRIEVTVGQVTEFLDVTVFSSAFDIEVRYLGDEPPPASQQAVFTEAAAFWRQVIVGDLPDFSASLDETTCADQDIPAVEEEIDDLIIFVWVDDIDGAGGTLGSAAPCWVRTASLFPIVGAMVFDEADVDNLESSGNLTSTIRHEMGHVLGIGTLWDAFGLLQAPSDTTRGGSLGADTHFTGSGAVAAFNSVGGSGYADNKVPVENDTDTYGPGSLDGHWRESVFDTELMSPSLNGGVPNPTSLVTIQSLADLGYVVNPAAAEPYTVVNPLAALTGGPADRIVLGDDIARGPILVVDEHGQVVRTIRR